MLAVRCTIKYYLIFSYFVTFCCFHSNKNKTSLIYKRPLNVTKPYTTNPYVNLNLYLKKFIRVEKKNYGRVYPECHASVLIQKASLPTCLDLTLVSLKFLNILLIYFNILIKVDSVFYLTINYIIAKSIHINGEHVATFTIHPANRYAFSKLFFTDFLSISYILIYSE